jgi:hypothetical protein
MCLVTFWRERVSLAPGGDIKPLNHCLGTSDLSRLYVRKSLLKHWALIAIKSVIDCVRQIAIYGLPGVCTASVCFCWVTTTHSHASIAPSNEGKTNDIVTVNDCGNDGLRHPPTIGTCLVCTTVDGFRDLQFAHSDGVSQGEREGTRQRRWCWSRWNGTEVNKCPRFNWNRKGGKRRMCGRTDAIHQSRSNWK